MKQKIKIKLDGVPETLMISARARYLESKRVNGIIHDPLTISMLDCIDYSFEGKKEVSIGSQVGTSIRTEIIDEQTIDFLKLNPDSVIVNLGCGLDTRYQRLDNGIVQWFDLDMPETIALRRNFFAESDKFKFIAKSILDYSWIDEIPKDKPTLFIAEGLLMYFAESEVRMILAKIRSSFSKSEFLIEGMSPFIAKNNHVDLKTYNAKFKWGIKTGREINQWNIGLKYVNEFYYFDRHKERIPAFMRMFTIVPSFRKAMKIMHLKSE